MIYLRENKPASTQFRSPRRQTLIGVIGTRTSGSIRGAVRTVTPADADTKQTSSS